MLQKIKNHLSTHFSFLENKKLLVAVSGGLDSMVLLHLFQQLSFEIAVLHCNFQLRANESDGDQQFVQDYCLQNQIPFFVKQFETEAFAKEFKLSTQVAARKLRYDWFYNQLEVLNADFILTAHHADDNLETFFINLSRGTGLDGLMGIPAQNHKTIRPLLIFGREELFDYAKKSNLQWREDSSNASDYYLRNKIRHHLIPLFKELNPNALDSFSKTQKHLKEAQSLTNDAAINLFQKIAKTENDTVFFDLKMVLEVPNFEAYLYQWLNQYGFTAWDDVYHLTKAQTGKMVLSTTHSLLKNRNHLILSPISITDKNQEFLIDETVSKVNFPLNISFETVREPIETSNNTIFVDRDLLQFPLKLRLRKSGDIFFPKGMKGKSKKISKLYKDIKLSQLEKNESWLLCSDNQIVWAVGIRQDERFAAEKNTKNILKITLKK